MRTSRLRQSSRPVFERWAVACIAFEKPVRIQVIDETSGRAGDSFDAMVAFAAKRA
jgi:hypothetical protein